MAGIYWFVFTQVFGRGVGHEPYIVFLLAGLLPWMWFTGRDLRLHAGLHARGEAHPLDDDPAHDLGRPAGAVEGHRVRRQHPGARDLRDAICDRTPAAALGGGLRDPGDPAAGDADARHRPDRRAARGVLPRPRARRRSSCCASCSTRRRSSTACSDLPEHARGSWAALQPARAASSACTARRSSPSELDLFAIVDQRRHVASPSSASASLVFRAHHPHGAEGDLMTPTQTSPIGDGSSASRASASGSSATAPRAAASRTCSPDATAAPGPASSGRCATSSFTVAPGEAIGVVGRNGQGKSTLLKLVAAGDAARRGHRRGARAASRRSSRSPAASSTT